MNLRERFNAWWRKQPQTPFEPEPKRKVESGEELHVTPMVPLGYGDPSTAGPKGPQCAKGPEWWNNSDPFWNQLGLRPSVEDEEKALRIGRFQVFQDSTGGWRWRLRAANSRVLWESEAYGRKYDAVRAVVAIERALKPGFIVELP